MDINTANDAAFAVIKTPEQFIIKINNRFHGPFPNTKEMVECILNLFTDIRE